MDRIIVCDDKPSIRTCLVDALSFDYEVHEATNGEEAIRLLTYADVPYVALILDVEMPGCNGYETLQILRDPDNGWPELKILMLTVRKEPENALKSWGLGADYYLTKPFSPTQVLETLAKALGREDGQSMQAGG